MRTCRSLGGMIETQHTEAAQSCWLERHGHPEAISWPKDVARCVGRERRIYGTLSKNAGAFLVIAILLLLAGCRPSHSGSIIVGSKNFSEQVLLAVLMAEHIEARMRAPVEQRLYV